MQRALNGFLTDGVLINNVANFYSSTKPLTRVNGSSLVVGDVWTNPSTGVEGFWNGTYWLTSTRFVITVGAIGVFDAVVASPVASSGLFTHEVFYGGDITGGGTPNWTASIYWNLNISNGQNVALCEGRTDSLVGVNSGQVLNRKPINQIGFPTTSLLARPRAVGSPTGFDRAFYSFTYSLVL